MNSWNDFTGGLSNMFSGNSSGGLLGMNNENLGLLGVALANAGGGGDFVNNMMMMKMLDGSGNSQPVGEKFSGTNPDYRLPQTDVANPNYIGFNPKLAAALPNIMNELTARGWQPTVASGMRTQAEQAEKVRLGYSQTMNSKHLTGKAADIIDKRYGWDNPNSAKFFQDLGEVAKQQGLQWGGDWKSFYDPAHIQTSLLNQSMPMNQNTWMA